MRHFSTKLIGGKRAGAGRKKLPKGVKRVAVTVKLPPAIRDWLKAQGSSQGKMIEAALIQHFRLVDE